MPYTVTAAVEPTLPGAVRLSIVGDAGVEGALLRVDGTYAAQPVRNYSTTGSGLAVVVDCEAPLGRPVSYNLRDYTGALLAQSNIVTCPPIDGQRGLLRSVLKPQVSWMEVEPADETGVEWASSTSVHRVVGRDTPVIVGEIRQRRSGIMSFLCRSISEADRLVLLLRDGTPMLLRHDPCAQAQTRDLLFYAIDVQETRWGRAGWRLVVVDYQESAFVPGDTDEPQSGWDFAALAAAAPDFAQLMGMYRTFSDMALDIRKTAGGVTPGLSAPSSLRVTASTQYSITLAWTNPPGGTGVPVVRRAAGAAAPATPTSGNPVALTAAGATTVTDTGRLPGTTYSYSVWAKNAAGELSVSPAVITTATLGYGVESGTVLTTLTSANNPYSSNTFTTNTYQINVSGTFRNYRFAHRVVVNSGDVEFVNCYFGGKASDTTTGSVALLLHVSDDTTHQVTATHCTFKPDAPYKALDAFRGHRASFTACEITETVDGFQCYADGFVSVVDSWIHDLTHYPNPPDTSHPDGSHNDGLQISQGQAYLIKGNLFDGSMFNTGIYISQELGVTGDVSIINNKFDIVQPDACINIYDAQEPTVMLNTTITGNVFRHASANPYQILVSTRCKNHASTNIASNVWDDGSGTPDAKGNTVPINGGA